jgi:hypothetical protein
MWSQKYLIPTLMSAINKRRKMDVAENPLGDRTNALALQRLQYYQGCAIIDLRYLQFGANGLIGTREVDEGNVEKLLKDFEIEGCGNLEPEHKIAAILDQEALNKALTRSNISREALLDPTNQPKLSFDGEVSLYCIYGRHRLKAGERFGETKWLVDLYSDGKLQYRAILY